jgi:hypothetical protein
MIETGSPGESTNSTSSTHPITSKQDLNKKTASITPSSDSGAAIATRSRPVD